MSYGAAIQSALFYIASCAPCRQARHHHDSRARAKEERKEKERLRAEHPDTYQHPDPFNTNPYWSEEIMMGPHTDVRKYRPDRSNSQPRGLSSAGNDNPSVAGSTNPAGSTTVVGDGHTLSQTTSMSEDWNKKRYQREDEELWGREFSRAGHRLMDAIKHAGSSAHRRIEASLGMEHKPATEEERDQFYFAPKNPPVNDYHPPIVCSRPSTRDANKWMLQPPPAAKIMNGKVPVSRSGSTVSHLSRKTTASDSPALGRRMHEKAMEAKLKNGETPTDELTPTRSRADSKASKRLNTASTSARQSWQSTRSRSVSVGSSDASGERAKRRMRRKSRPLTPAETESSEDDDEFYQLKSATPSSNKSAKAARKPKLSTINSSHGSDKSAIREASQSSADYPMTPRSTVPTLDVADALQRPRPAVHAKHNNKTSGTTSKASPISEPLTPKVPA